MKSRPLITAAAVLATTTRAQAQVVQLGIEKRHPSHSLDRRAAADALDVPVLNNQSEGGYFVTVDVGTPAQQLTLQLDTGSSDLWIPSKTSTICRTDGCKLGSFDSSASSSFEIIGKESFSIQYVDNSFAEGDYFQDVFSLGEGVSIQNLTMGIGYQTNIGDGILGVGFPDIEASVKTAGKTYPNLPFAMQQNGLIKTVAYSLWLNDLDASKGSILFGGIDTEKYVGDLRRLKLVPSSQRDDSKVSEFAVALYSLEASSSSGSDLLPTQETSVVVILDSGTTLSYLPQDWAEQAWEEVGAIYDPQSQLPLLPCAMQNSNGVFSFGFGGPNGPKINVTMGELVLDVTTGRPPKFKSGPYKGQPICVFGVQNQTSSPYLLGDSFLRSAYVVYDLVNEQVAMAPTNFNATKTNVVPFPSSGAPIPSASAVASQLNSPATVGPERDNFTAQAGFMEADKGSSESAARSLVAFSGSSGIIVVGLTMLHLLMSA